MASTGWIAYEQTLATHIQNMELGRVMTVQTTRPDGHSETFSSLDEIMRAFQKVKLMADDERALASTSLSKHRAIKINGSRNW